ncbi:P-loop containing nucleoside triphosphate hydrolase protein, partial [Mycena olivaceomarginata]
MPYQPTVIEIRIVNIIGCLESAITLLDELNKAFRTPFLQAISNTTLSLITAVQNAKKSKDECIQLMELMYQVLLAIANLHIKSETPGSLPASTIDHLKKFLETIHKIHTFVEAQQDGNRLKNFFRHSEMNSLLKDCHAGLKQVLELFKIKSGPITLANIREMRNEADNIHKELLELISSLSDGTASDRASSMYRTLNDSQLSSKSFSMLPGRPQIFHGRDSELNEISQMLAHESARIAILGPGGIGKTSLARAALHHPDVTAKYGDCFFVPCDSALNSIELAALIGAYIGLKPGKDLTKPVIQYFSGKSTCLLVLDNLETTWEPLVSRKSVEEFLSLLTDIDHLALMITMRGAERPTKVCWTRPFLQPLNPLSSDAAKQMFIDIADEFHKAEEVDQLLQLTDNMPLAVDLIAHLVDADGCSSVLSRWETEKTSLLSDGHDRGSSLDASIKVSLSSPRLTTFPGAKDLLSVLSILPDGLSDIELQESCLPIPDVLACKVVLLSTALAYIDNTKRLKSLVPIREHMQCFYPPVKSFIEPLCKYFHLLLNLYQKYYGSSEGANRINQLTLNLGNLHQILLRGLLPENADPINTVDCILSLNSFMRRTGRGWHVLMDHVPSVVHQVCDPRTEARFSTELLFSSYLRPILNPEQFISKAIAQFSHFNDPVLESHFYRGAGCHHVFLGGNTTEGIAFLQRALSLARSVAHLIHEER